jgi:copper chaperone CopZ
MKKLLTLVLCLLPLLPLGCFRQELHVAEYHIPAMSSPAAEAYIQARLKTVPGVKTISSNLENRTLTVSYQSNAIRTMNIEEAISILGFSVNNRPANPKAKLPKGLK